MNEIDEYNEIIERRLVLAKRHIKSAMNLYFECKMTCRNSDYDHDYVDALYKITNKAYNKITKAEQ